MIFLSQWNFYPREFKEDLKAWKFFFNFLALKKILQFCLKFDRKFLETHKILEDYKGKSYQKKFFRLRKVCKIFHHIFLWKLLIFQNKINCFSAKESKKNLKLKSMCEISLEEIGREFGNTLTRLQKYGVVLGKYLLYLLMILLSSHPEIYVNRATHQVNFM